MKVGRSFFGWLSIALFSLIPHYLSAQVPQIINYQGRVMVNGVNFHGEGLFKFALVDPAGTTVYWSNDTLAIDGTPTNAVTIFVTQGLFSVPLGDKSITNMAAFPPGIFSDHTDIYLRTWFSDGSNDFEHLLPDQRINAVAFSLVADGVPEGAITTAMIANGTIRTDDIENGTIAVVDLDIGEIDSRYVNKTGDNMIGTLSTAAIGGNPSLDLQTDGMTRLHIDDATGNIGIGTIQPEVKLHVDGEIIAKGPMIDIRAYEGNDAGVKIQAAIADAPDGAVISALGLIGEQTISTTIVVNKPVTILFGGATYTFTGTGTIFEIQSDAVTLEGAGRGPKTSDLGPTRFVLPNTSSAKHITGNDINLLQLRDMTFVGPGRDESSGGGITLTHTTNGNVNGLVFENILLSDVASTGISINSPIMSSFRNVRVSRAKEHGIRITGGTSVNLNAIYVSGVYQAGIRLEGVSYSTLQNTAVESAGIGYDIDSSFNITLISPGAEEQTNRSAEHNGTAYRVEGGKYINLISPYSRSVPETGSFHFCLEGAKNAVISNPRVNQGVSTPTHDIFVDSTSENVELVTDLDADRIRDEGMNTLIRSGTRFNDLVVTGIIQANEFTGDGSQLINLVVDTSEITNDSVTSEKIAPNAVSTSKIADNTVNGDDIADNSIANADLSIGSFQNITGVGDLDSLTVTGDAYLATDNGNVGIGTTTSEYKLEAKGRVNLDDVIYTTEFDDWTITNIGDDNNSVLATSTYALDSNHIFVSYARRVDGDNVDLKIAETIDGGMSWSTFVVDSEGEVGEYNSIHVINEDTIFISYYDNRNRDLKFAKWAGGLGWDISTIESDTDLGKFTSISAVDANTIFISYQQGNSNLRFARSVDGGSTWEIGQVDSAGTGALGLNSSVYALDGDNIFISHRRAGADGELKFAKSNDGGTTWFTSIVELNGSANVDADRQYTSIFAADVSTIFISYLDGDNFDLKFAKSVDGGGTWSTSTLDSEGNVGTFASLYAANADTVFISYYDETKRDLKLARSTDGGSSWSVSVLDSFGEHIGWHASIHGLNAETIFITYLAADSYRLRFYKEPGNPVRNVGIGTQRPEYKLQVGEAGDGTKLRVNAIAYFSDGRWKSDLRRIKDPVDKIEALTGTYFRWKNRHDRGQQLGLIAQEVEKVFPEVVSTDSQGYKSVDYGKLTPVLIEAIKQQKGEIDAQRDLVNQLKSIICADHSDADICQEK